MGLLKKEPAPTTSTTEDRLRTIEREIKYKGYSPKAAAIIEENDRRMDEHLRGIDERAERMKATAKQKADLLNSTTNDLLKRGNLKITINGKKITSRDGLKCSECGSTINDAVLLSDTMTQMWIGSGGNFNALAIRNARGPLSAFMGMPFAAHGASCRSCGTDHEIRIQLSVMA